MMNQASLPLKGSSEANSVRSEQVKLLYAAVPLSVLATLINATVLVAIEWNVTNHAFSIIWFACLLAISLVRFAQTYFYQKDHLKSVRTAYWETHFTIGALLAGAIWGSASFFLFPETSIAHQVFVAFVVGVMCAASITTLSPLLAPALGFMTLALGALIVRFFMVDSEVASAMGGMLTLFYVLISVSAFRIHRNIQQNILLRMESQRSEEALAQSERRFRELFEGNRSIQLIVNPDDGKIIEANQAAEQFYGYSREQFFELNISDLNTLSEEDVRAEMELAQAQERNHFIFKHRLASGDLKDVEVHSGPIDWNEKKVLYSIIHDISERKRAEHLAESTADILKMVASGEIAEKIYSAICSMYEHRYSRMRSSILKLEGNQLFHCSAPNLPDEYISAINGVEIGPSTGSCGTAAFLKKTVIVENISTDPLWSNYKEVALPHHLQACWSVPIKGSEGQVLGTFAMYFNHPMKPTDEELREINSASELVSIVMEREGRETLLRKLSQAIEQAGESIMITDKRGMIEYVNPSFTKLTGYLPEEVLGKNPNVLKSGNQSGQYYQRLWNTIQSGEVWNSQVIDRRKDGSEYSALMTISPILNSDGNVSNYVGIQQDLTSHKLLEEKFHQAQKMEAIGTLVGGIAHDFNNMLAGMTGNLYLAKKQVGDMPDVVKKLDSVTELSFSAADMIKQLLVFARKGAVEMKPFGLTSFVKETSKLNTASIPENIIFHSEFASDELIVKGDATQLQQVLMNLLNNARDAVVNSPSPRISFKIQEFEADDDFLSKHDEVDSRLFAHLIVEDNGTGISEADQEHIFEPFFTTKEVGRGTGLGLSMAYGVIKNHGGVLEVNSTVGKGTTFNVYLPLLEEKIMMTTQHVSGEVVRGNGELILIADDNAQVREASKEVLNSLGYRVVEASNGLEAVDRFFENQHEVSLVIMDVVMPRLGGVAAIERIKSIQPELKVIFATGYDKDETLKGEMPSVEYIVLSKPYNVVELSQVIREQLDA